MKYEFVNKSPRILVVGDLMLDKYFWGSADRISPEAPVPVVAVKKESQSLGGAGNVINNLLALGAKVSVASVLGDDEAGVQIESSLRKAGADVSGLATKKDRITGVKTRIMATHNQIVRFDKESVEDITNDIENEIIEFVNANIQNIDALLLSDYKKGVLTNNLTQALIKKANELDIPVLCDPKGADYTKYKGATLLTPNKKEAELATKINVSCEQGLIAAGDYLKNELSLKYSIITLSEDGIGIFDGGKMTRIPTFAKEVYDVTGAGDTVLSALGFALACKANILDACHFANEAAAVVVGKLGSATATMAEILSFDKQKTKLVTKEQISQLAKELKSAGNKVVFTNGCFDILHAGHVRYLNGAKEFGDVLVLGLNSDTSVKRLKGENRPINNELDRAEVLAGLSAIDYIVVFDEDTPLELIQNVSPDILVKGADYTVNNIVGADFVIANGGSVRTVELVDGRSTTNIIQKIKAGN